MGPPNENPARAGWASVDVQCGLNKKKYTAPATKTQAPFAIPNRPGNHRLPCPQCDRGPRDDALSCTVQADGTAVYLCFRCGLSGADGVMRRGEIPQRRKPEPEKVTRHEVAHRIINEAVPADPRHPYLVRKRIQPHGAWQIDDRLVLPVMQPGLLVGVQFISREGSKKFLTGSKISGSYWFLGDPVINAPGGEIVICEGFATAASIHEATGWAVLIAFTASNMKTVAIDWRRSLPDAHFTLAADDDPAGQKAATEAAKAVHGRVMKMEAA